MAMLPRGTLSSSVSSGIRLPPTVSSSLLSSPFLSFVVVVSVSPTLLFGVPEHDAVSVSWYRARRLRNTTTTSTSRRHATPAAPATAMARPSPAFNMSTKSLKLVDVVGRTCVTCSSGCAWKAAFCAGVWQTVTPWSTVIQLVMSPLSLTRPHVVSSKWSLGFSSKCKMYFPATCFSLSRLHVMCVTTEYTCGADGAPPSNFSKDTPTQWNSSHTFVRLYAANARYDAFASAPE
ncbi:hypothetical protein H257_13849 [Aphanomyces astaci]|uniref:Uncharacterized protein n=1 Tax=Aphanomyces astaci TaxID=112090 RepID=W4FVT5_APHAT|nr:hypothetical protein H257_13849 [Aphanomyces astaci]ETV70763.1 hypothetical protein H257_13849 [Aphanomyces astaci]|eukprot:XP_009839827.1 hypothetical protein H257_13849 [Aphanomyces astaci]